MKWILACSISFLAVGFAQEAFPVAEVFDVKGVIAAPVAKLAVPAMLPQTGEPQLLVFSSSLEAQKHVRQGFALIHASWDFEAYRHFTTALEADPQCLMAYCGIVLSLTSPRHEFNEQRAVSYNRMLTLAEFKVDGQFYYPENERMYAVAIAELVVNGLGNSVRVFRQLCNDYPNDLQAKLLTTYLSRGGYNVLGNPRVKQRMAVEEFEELVRKNPEDPMALNFLIMAQAEAPSSAVDFKNDLLPRALKLSEISEGKVATWQALLGFIAMRSGDAPLAEKSYREAIALFEKWQEVNKLSAADNDGLIRSQLFLASVLHAQGKTKEASVLVSSILKTKIEDGREYSAGALSLKWCGQLMPFRMHIESGEPLSAKLSLPQPTTTNRKDMDPYSAILLAYQLYADTLLSLGKKEFTAARKQHGQLGIVLSDMQKMQTQISQSYEVAYFMPALSSLIVLHKELTAQLSEKDGLAYNWYQAAIEALPAESRLLPSEILFPVEYRMGLYQKKVGMAEEAKASFKKALERRPLYLKAQVELDALKR
ncbi:MAG: tetratricopeptide repeat protein [Rubritalea sp.]|uniref:tetratricopeptide repeat protein n=1 Tax=Rubritalea sp. TaxID=2109375 RepID=UPI0032426136